MNQSKDLLIQLYEQGDAKRKKMLFELYKPHFFQNFSVAYLIAIINADLGKDLITQSEVKYIREHFVKKEKPNKIQFLTIPKPIEKSKTVPIPTDEIVWSDPDELSKNNKYLTKFSKQ